MISPEFQHLIYKQQERELLEGIEQMRMIKKAAKPQKSSHLSELFFLSLIYY